MPSVLIHLDDATYKILNKVAPPDKRRRTEFVRKAIREAIRQQEFARMREAYLKQPDSDNESDDWTNWEPFES
jgi:predicted transcriptional regulator